MFKTTTTKTQAANTLTSEPLLQRPQQYWWRQHQLLLLPLWQLHLQRCLGWPLTSGWQKPQLWDYCCFLSKFNFSVIVRQNDLVHADTKEQRGEKNATVLTHWTQRCDPSIVLSWQVLLVANRAHAVSPWVTIETTPSGTQHRNWALIGLLGHRDVYASISPGDANERHTEKFSIAEIQPSLSKHFTPRNLNLRFRSNLKH